MAHRKKNLLKDRRGVIMVLYAFGLVALIMGAALAINLMGVMSRGTSVYGPQQEQANMQIAADAAARAAAMVALPLQGETTQLDKATATALAVAGANNYGTAIDDQIEVNIGLSSRPIKEGNYKNVPYAVEVIITRPYRFPFLIANLQAGPTTLRARSVAAWRAAPCVVALNTSTKPKTGITVSGGSEIFAKCGIYSNSTVTVNGSDSQLCAYAVAAYDSADIGATCSDSAYSTSSPQPLDQQIVDPYKNVDFKAPADVETITPSSFGKKDWTEVDNLVSNLKPGKYDSKTGNVTFSKDHIFPAGTYYFDSLAIGSGTMTATAGVTFVVNKMRMTGGTLNLTAPATKSDLTPFEDMAIVDLESGSGASLDFTSAGVTANVNGIIYAPYAEVSYAASKVETNTDVCLNIWAWAVKISGGASFGKSCPPSGFVSGGFVPAGLVE